MKKIGGVLGRSPVGALREHMAKVMECLEVFKEAQLSYINGCFDLSSEHAGKIANLEHEADLIKESIKRSISRSIFASVSRGDMLSLVHKSDDIADACQDVVRFLTLHQMTIPPGISRKLKTLTEKIMQAGEMLYKALVKTVTYEEQELLPGKTGEIYNILSNVKHGEWETDEIQISYVREVFKTGDDLKASDFFFLMNLGRRTVVIADHMENVADGLQSLISR